MSEGRILVKLIYRETQITSYELVIDIQDYLTKIVRETTEGIELNKTFIIDINVDPIKQEIILPLIKYDFNKFDLRPESIVDLDKLVESLLDNPNVVVELKSHTDFIGSNAQNNKLSQQRADVCVSYLVSKGESFKDIQEFTLTPRPFHITCSRPPRVVLM